MFKRILSLTVILFSLIGAGTLVWSQGDCDFSYSNYARAVQLHDMGDYDRALRHYKCAQQEDPESAIIPILIEKLREDSANAGRAWSSEAEASSEPVCNRDLGHQALGKDAYDRGDSNWALIHLHCALLRDPHDVMALELMGRIHIDRGDTHSARYYFNRAEVARIAAMESQSAPSTASSVEEPQPAAEFKMPDWLTPYETVPDSRNSAQVQPIVILSEQSRLLMQSERMLVVEDDDSLTSWRLLRRLIVERTQLTVTTGEMSVTLYQRHVFAMTREARITVSLTERSTDAREQARQAFKAGDIDSAIDWMLKVTSEAGVTVDDYAFLAGLYSKRGDVAGAEASLLDALELDSSRLDIRCKLGRHYSSLGDYARAFAQFYKVIAKEIGAICPEHDEFVRNRARSAPASVATVETPQASPAQATFERGMAMLDDRKLFAAANTFMEALELDPGHHEARCQFGIVLTEWSNYGWALTKLRADIGGGSPKRLRAPKPQGRNAGYAQDVHSAHGG